MIGPRDSTSLEAITSLANDVKLPVIGYGGIRSNMNKERFILNKSPDAYSISQVSLHKPLFLFHLKKEKMFIM